MITSIFKILKEKDEVIEKLAEKIKRVEKNDVIEEIPHQVDVETASEKIKCPNVISKQNIKMD